MIIILYIYIYICLNSLRCTPFQVNICSYSIIFVLSFFWLHLQVNFHLRSLISFVVAPDGYCCALRAVQDTSCKIVTCLIMSLPCNRDHDIFSDVSACTYIFSPIFTHTYFASTDFVLCLASIFF